MASLTPGRLFEGKQVMEHQQNTEDKDVGRRGFIKSAAVLTATSLAASAPGAIGRATFVGTGVPVLDEQLGRLEDEGRLNLAHLLEKLAAMGMGFDYEVTSACLIGALVMLDLRRQREAEEAEHQRYIEHRDRLSGQARIDFVIEQFKRQQVTYFRAAWLRGVLDRIESGEMSEPGWRHGKNLEKHVIGLANLCLEGCSDGFRRKVIAQFRRDILPAIEARCAQEDAEQAAIDEFVNLTEGKTPEEIHAMTRRAKEQEAARV
jgi:hypothetical protein